MCCFFFFNDTATTEIYTLSLHDALPIWVYLGCFGTCCRHCAVVVGVRRSAGRTRAGAIVPSVLCHRVLAVHDVQRHREQTRLGLTVLAPARSEEHTSELQSLTNLVCRLLLEKKKNTHPPPPPPPPPPPFYKHHSTFHSSSPPSLSLPPILPSQFFSSSP